MESRSEAAGSAAEWEERYQLGDTPWEKGSAHPALIEWVATNSISGRVIVPGCGLGHDVRVLAVSGAEVVGLDLAPSAVAGARAFPRLGHETYIRGDFFDPRAVEGEFDWLFEHTCFCAIDPDRRGDYVRRVTTLLKPGGHLLAIFFLDPDNDEDGPPYGCSLEELDALFSTGFRVVGERGELPTYPGREGRELLRVLVRI